jgi:hypothetical protein
VDPFVPGALLGAMASGEPLEVPSVTPISTRLLEGIGRAQEILHSWNPALRRVEVRATAEPAPHPGGGVAAFCSGGVDSGYTLLRHGASISHLLLVHGLEITIDNEPLFADVLKATRSFAEETGRQVVPIRTNLRQLADAHRLSNYLFQGAILAGCALSAGFGRTYIAAGRTYSDLTALGSHPMLDPLWSTEACELVHDGVERRRIEKVAAVARSGPALRVLRVCLANATSYNCGRCEKCLRTMVTLRLVGASAPTFPPFDAADLRHLPLHAEAISFLLDNLELAEQVGDHEIASGLRAALRRYRLVQLVRDIDELLLGSLLKRVYRIARPAPREPPEIGCLPERYGSRRRLV